MNEVVKKNWQWRCGLFTNAWLTMILVCCLLEGVLYHQTADVRGKHVTCWRIVTRQATRCSLMDVARTPRRHLIRFTTNQRQIIIPCINNGPSLNELGLERTVKIDVCWYRVICFQGRPVLAKAGIGKLDINPVNQQKWLGKQSLLHRLWAHSHEEWPELHEIARALIWKKSPPYLIPQWILRVQYMRVGCKEQVIVGKEGIALVLSYAGGRGTTRIHALLWGPIEVVPRTPSSWVITAGWLCIVTIYRAEYGNISPVLHILGQTRGLTGDTRRILMV